MRVVVTPNCLVNMHLHGGVVQAVEPLGCTFRVRGTPIADSNPKLNCKCCQLPCRTFDSPCTLVKEVNQLELIISFSNNK